MQDAEEVVRFRAHTPMMLSGVLALLLLQPVYGQSWVSTGTKAIGPSLQNATQLGLLPATTPLHIVVGLKMQNADQVQPTLKRMLTPGDALYGTSLTVDQFVAQFGATGAQVQAVQSYLASFGFSNIQVEPNQLMVQADETAQQAEAAFNTSLMTFSQSGQTIFANTLDVQVPSSLSGIVLAVLGLNNIQALHSDIRSTVPCTPPGCTVPAVANETYPPQQYQIVYDAPCPPANPTSPAPNFPTGSTTPVGIIAEGSLTQVVKDLRAFEAANKLPPVPATVVTAG